MLMRGQEIGLCDDLCLFDDEQALVSEHFNVWTDSTLISSSNDHFTVYYCSNCMFCSLRGCGAAQWKASVPFPSKKHTCPFFFLLHLSQFEDAAYFCGHRSVWMRHGGLEATKIMSTKWNRWDCMKSRCILPVARATEVPTQLYFCRLIQLCGSNNFWRYWTIWWRTRNMENLWSHLLMQKKNMGSFQHQKL